MQQPLRTLKRRKHTIAIAAAFMIGMLLAVAGAAILMSITKRKTEETQTHVPVVTLTEETDDPAFWGKNFPNQYESFKRTTDQVRTRYGGSEAVPRTPTASDPRSIVAQSRLEEDPRLKTIWAGYAFATDFREERGHAYMLDDQTYTERQNVTHQPTRSSATTSKTATRTGSTKRPARRRSRPSIRSSRCSTRGPTRKPASLARTATCRTSASAPSRSPTITCAVPS